MLLIKTLQVELLSSGVLKLNLKIGRNIFKKFHCLLIGRLIIYCVTLFTQSLLRYVWNRCNSVIKKPKS